MCNLSQSILEQGKLTTLLDLVKEGLISIRDAAAKLGISEEEFSKKYLNVEQN